MGFLLRLLVLFWLFSGVGSLCAQTIHADYWDGELYVRMASSTPQRTLPVTDDPEQIVDALADMPNLQRLATEYGFLRIEKWFTVKVDALLRTYVVVFDDIAQAEELVVMLEALPEVELAERRPLDRVFTNTPNDPNQSLWHLQKIQAFDAWNLSTGSASVSVGIVDDAVRVTHQDLAANMLPGVDVTVAESHPNHNNPNPPADKADHTAWSHGTHCAGITSAVTNNNFGIPSIGYNIKIVPVKAAQSSGDGKSISHAYAGVNYLTNLPTPVDVASFSWGSSSYSFTNQLAMNSLASRGTIIVAAAGNDNSSEQGYPAAYTNVIAVAASNQTDRKASFSNFGSWVDISAPGTTIHSTIAGENGSNTAFVSYSGTSMATPLVAGLLGLAKSYRPDATRNEIVNCLYSSADDIDDLNPSHIGQLGAGRINAFAMLQCLAQAAPKSCSGEVVLTANSGVVTDGAGEYENNSDCSWRIQPQDGGQVRLVFTAFDTEADADFVRVYDGSNASAPLLGTYSGTNTPPTLESTGNALFVRFTSNASNTANGFSANYSSFVPDGSFCSGQTTLTANSGTFSDGSGASNYQNNSDCSWLIQPENGARVVLNFTSFYTEATFDVVRVYDGATTGAPLLGTFSGASMPPQQMSSGNAMLVRFTSDGSITRPGFAASWSTETFEGNCSGLQLLTANSGTFSDGSSPEDNYENNANCSWRIRPQNGDAVQLTFSRFATEQNFDIVRVYDGLDNDAPLLGSYSGSSLPPTLVSTGNGLFVTFTSDFSVTDKGFSAAWQTAPLQCDGLRTLSSPTGVLSTGPEDYEPFSDCSWHIAPQGAERIELTFTSFHTENNFDPVHVYNGANADAPLINTYSGNLQTPFTVTAESGQMFVRFTSDFSIQFSGFEATYNAPGATGRSRSAQATVAHKLYPNPATDRLTFEMAGSAKLQLLNGLGQVVFTSAHTNRTNFSVVDVPAGLYTLRVQPTDQPAFAIKCTLLGNQ